MVEATAPARRIFVLGATGGTGGAFVDQALAHGHRITAFVRSPGKMGPPRSGLTVVEGDPRSTEALKHELSGHDAVVSALGPKGLGKTTILRDAAETVITAMEATGVRRLLIVSAAVLFEDAGPLAAILRRTLLKNVFVDGVAMEQRVRASSVDWTLARPPRLTNGPVTGHYAIADDALPGRGATLSRPDVAHFLLSELEHPAHVRKVVGIAY